MRANTVGGYRSGQTFFGLWHVTEAESGLDQFQFHQAQSSSIVNEIDTRKEEGRMAEDTEELPHSPQNLLCKVQFIAVPPDYAAFHSLDGNSIQRTLGV